MMYWLELQIVQNAFYLFTLEEVIHIRAILLMTLLKESVLTKISCWLLPYTTLIFGYHTQKEKKNQEFLLTIPQVKIICPSKNNFKYVKQFFNNYSFLTVCNPMTHTVHVLEQYCVIKYAILANKSNLNFRINQVLFLHFLNNHDEATWVPAILLKILFFSVFPFVTVTYMIYSWPSLFKSSKNSRLAFPTITLLPTIFNLSSLS